MIRPERSILRMKKGEPVKILGFGDSLTQGWLVNRGYLFFLNEMLRDIYPSCDISFINMGIPGNTSEEGVGRVYRDVIKHNPDLILVQFALNDAYTGISLPEFRENIRSIITSILSSSSESEIMLVTSVPLQDELENRHAGNFYSVLQSLAAEYKLPFAEVHRYWSARMEEGLDPDFLYQFDGIHPTEEGYRIMAEAIFLLLKYS